MQDLLNVEIPLLLDFRFFIFFNADILYVNWYQASFESLQNRYFPHIFQTRWGKISIKILLSKKFYVFLTFINFFHKSRENKILRQKYKDQRKTWSIYSIYQETTRKVKTHYSLKITQENHKPDDYQIQSFFCLIFLFHISKFFRKKLCRKDKKEMMIKCCDINNSQRKQKNPFSKLKYSIIVKSKNGIYLSSKTLLLTER